MSWYLTIRADSTYSQSIDAAQLFRLLDSLAELRRSGPMTFEAAPQMPWLSLIVAQADSDGCYAVQGPVPSSVNLVELVCSYSEDAAWYNNLAGRIASSLGWEAIEEHHCRQVWPPPAPES